MRSISIVICSFFLFFSCKEESLPPEEVILGKWRLVSVDEEPIETNEGLQFAPNKQFFRMDSQGKPIPKLMEKIWSINVDTLTFVDYNWEPQFIEKKGTKKFIINELNENKLDLTLQGENRHRYIYKPF